MRVGHFCQIEPEFVIGSSEIFDLYIAIVDRLFHAINEMLAVQMVWISFDPWLGLCPFREFHCGIFQHGSNVLQVHLVEMMLGGLEWCSFFITVVEHLIFAILCFGL